MAEAGWYPDPGNPGWLRYFDGNEWTEHRDPIASTVPTDWQPTGTFPPVPPPVQPSRSTNRGRLLLIGGVVLVLVAGLLTGGYFLFLRGGPTLTYQGHQISDAKGVLTTAESNLSAVVSKRHGAKAADTRCYYAVPTTAAPGAKKTDVDQDLRCGPVLFVDGDAAQSYLNFGLRNSQTSGQAKLTVASQPEAPTPAAIPADFTLKRPDGKTPPSGSGGLTPPAPPAADKGVLVSADIGSQNLAKAPDSAVMGSLSGGISLTNLGPVTRYGSGDSARSAPAGQKLIAFKTAGAPGNDATSSDLSASAGVSVDGSAAKPLPTKVGAYYVLAVPTSVKTADLVLANAGLTQSISLLDGKPGPNNIAVLARKNRVVSTPATAPVTFTYSPEVGFEDGSSGTSQTATATFNSGDLSYVNTATGTAVTASSAKTAILHLDVYYAAVHDPGPFAFPADLVTFTPTGGAPIAAKDIGGAKGVYLIFEVPAGLTTGTITLSGSATQTYGNTTGTYKESVPTAVTIPFSLAAG
jgi:hypothetical protein